MLIIIFACVLLAAVGQCDAAGCSATTSWEQTEGALTKVSVGPGGVWGISHDDKIWYRDGTYGSAANIGSGWTEVDRPNDELLDLDVGDDVVWGVTQKGQLTCRNNINESSLTGDKWKILENKARDVAISPKGQLVAINELGQFSYREGLSSRCSRKGNWITDTDSSLNLTQISIGEAGIWAVATDEKIYHRPGSFGDSGNIGTEWEQVPGASLTVGVGKDFIIVANNAYQIWRRDGVTACTTGGSDWVLLSGALKVVDAYDGCYAWGVNPGQDIWLGTF